MLTGETGEDGSPRPVVAEGSQQDLPASQGQNSASGSHKGQQQHSSPCEAAPGTIPDAQSPPSPAIPSKSPAASEKFYSPVSGTINADMHHPSQNTEPGTRIIPDSSDEVRKSNKSPQGADVHSLPDSSQPKPTVEALPRVLPREITDTSDEVQRSNEDPQNATLRSQSTRKWDPSQLQRQGHIEAADNPDAGPPSTSPDRAPKDSTNRASAVSKSASDLSAPVSSQWALLNEEGIQHGSGGLRGARLRSLSPHVHQSIPPTPSEEANLQSPLSDRSLEPSPPPQKSLNRKDGSQPAVKPSSSTESDGKRISAEFLPDATQKGAMEGEEGANCQHAQEEDNGRAESDGQYQEQGSPIREDATDPMQQQEEFPLEKALPPDPEEDNRAPVPLEHQKPPQSSKAPLLATDQSEGLDNTDKEVAMPFNKSLQQEQEPAAANSQLHSQSTKISKILSQPAPPSIQALDLSRTPFAIKTVIAGDSLLSPIIDMIISNTAEEAELSCSIFTNGRGLRQES